MEHSNKIAIVIPTKDRPEFMERLLTSIGMQSRLPDQIIIADGSDNPIDEIIGHFPDLPIELVRVRPPRLTKQKNAGVALVKPGIDLVGIIDDDIVLDEGALESMLAFWAGAGNSVGGACFNITNSSPSDSPFARLLKKVFFIDNQEIGSINRSGCITPIWDAGVTRQVQWLGGGYTVWRKRLFDQWEFDEWFPANGLFEDVHFSYRAGKEYQLMVVAEAKVQHAEAPVPAKGQVVLGRRQIVHWVYFVSNHADLSMPMCLWSCVGRMSVNLTMGILRRDLRLLSRAFGNFHGLGIVCLAAVNPSKFRARL